MVQVKIEPLLTVDIRELTRLDSRTNNSTAVMIRPRSEASQEKLVSLELQLIRRPAALQEVGLANPYIFMPGLPYSKIPPSTRSI